VTAPPAAGRPLGPTTRYPVRPALPVRTARLVLRPWRPDDGDHRDAHRRMLGDPDVVRFLYDPVLDAGAADARLADRRAEIVGPGAWMNLAVELVGPGTVVGDVGLAWMGDDHRQAEIGYLFLPAHHGNGYATEAAAAMVDVAIDQFGAHRVCGTLDRRNEASAALLRRLGMRHEATLVDNEWVTGEWTGEAVYAVLASEWTAHRAAG
jgi:RimJ/RimL family protein N-acetyltransferase